MKITILNGSPSPDSFDRYLDQLIALLEPQHTVDLINLRDEDIRYCVGCFGCWVKTPGLCSSNDGSCEFRKSMIHSDFTLWAAPLEMGFPHHLLKMALDKSIPLIHPYFVVDHGEAHHRPRYSKHPRLGLLLGKEPDTDLEDLQIVQTIFSRTAINLKGELEFCLTTEKDPESIAALITTTDPKPLPRPKPLTHIPGETIQPPKKVALFNGSPRGRKGNTPIMLSQFGEGFSSIEGNTFSISHLNRIQDHPKFVDQISSADCVWVGFPLYTDAMPGLVKTFIESLAPLKNRSINPPIGFLVQSGFPEALHSRYIERYLHKLATRINAPYLGTIVKGGGEGVRLRSDEANQKLFANLRALGKYFGQFGTLDPDHLKLVAGTERFNPILVQVFKLLVNIPLLGGYWDNQLKENGVFEDRFAMPYHE